MTDDDKAALSARIKQAVEHARARNLHVWGYEVRDGSLSLLTRPAERKRRTPEPVEPPADNRPRVRRGAVQGSLL